MEMDLGAELGAEGGYSTQRLTLYIPNKDKDGQDLQDLERWVKEARELLSHIGGGSTTYPPADGTWVNEKGELLWEQTRIVYCYIFPDQFRARIKNLREFLHRFGRDTNQGEVVVEFDGRFFRIRKFDSSAGT
jgi:hypothetical protein